MALLHLRFHFLFLFVLISNLLLAQKFGFNDVLKNKPNEPTVFCVPNNEFNLIALKNESIHVKFKSENWLFITSTPSWINQAMIDKRITDFYFEFAPPAILADSARSKHFVNEVHSGQGPLGVPYTGAGVIVGIVDQGIDVAHEDFLDANGNTRILRYWDHTMPVGPRTPAEYGYGQVWDSTDINAGDCTSSEETTAHGTSVAGIAVGDGSANGTNKGMAPDANIIIVESNFNLSNWTLSIADAIDYVFRVADTLNMPAVVNLSLGTYMGSHDGNDPAAEMIETLLDAKPGRIVVGAAGNSGAQVAYHQHSNVTTDTNFVWFVDNPSASFGANTIFFDLWTDQSDALFDFAFGADTPSAPFSFRGRTNFHGAMSSLGVTIYDTIWNGANQIATIEVYTEIIDNAYHMQILAEIDSLNYNYRFETTGAGQYDLWSGAWLGYNNMLTVIPTVAQMPKIVDYVLPDKNQIIVSSWNCSEKVVSVGNFRNRQGHIDRNYNVYINLTTPPGQISPNSSSGPNRHNVTKPDVSASGDVSLGAGPLWVLGNPAYYSVVDSGGMHVRNGGTSMASPIVAGIAALYLERCRYATYDQFLTNLQGTAYTDGFTGAVPNNTYGFGKPHAFDLLSNTTLPAQPTIDYATGINITSSPSTYYQWYLDGMPLANEDNQLLATAPPYGDYQVMVGNAEGCTALSNPFTVTLNLNELSETNAIVYPNPSTQFIEFKGVDQIENVTATDNSGKAIVLIEKGSQRFDISKLAAGKYVLSVKSATGIQVVNLVKVD